jgi:CRP/FNR family transcriptional regulator, cyclic AMP receptor protein
LAGARDTFVLLLLDGFAKVTAADMSDGEVLVDIRSAGDVVGEVSAFDSRPRSATLEYGLRSPTPQPKRIPNA